MKWAGILAASACLVSAQQSDEVRVSAHAYVPPQLHLSVQANLVQLEVVVRDPRGHAVGGMTQGDFEILDEGKPREISAFSVETREGMQASETAATAAAGAPSAGAAPNAPVRSTLLFFDDLHEVPAELQRTQAAAKRFIKDGLGPGARAAVYTASQGLVLDLTADAGALTKAIEKIRSHQRISEAGLQPCPRISPYQAFLIDNGLDSTALQAAIQEAQACQNTDPTLNSVYTKTSAGPGVSTLGNDPISAAVLSQASQTWQQARIDSKNSFDAMNNALTLLARAPGTRVLLMVSTGFLTGMMDAERDAVTDRAIRTGIVINAIDARGLWSEAPGRQDAQDTTKGFPLSTFAFETANIGTQADAMNAVMREFASGTGGLFFHNSNDLAGGFSQLGAVPETTYLIGFRPNTEGTPKYRKLKVRLTAKNGDYIQARPGYMPPSNTPPPEMPAERKVDVELLASDTVTQIPVELAGMMGKGGNEAAFSLFIKVDIGKLNFAQRDGRHLQKLTFIGALLDSGGKIVSAKEGAMDFSLKDDTLTRLTANGVRATLGLNAPPGPYKVRVVVQDAEGKLAAQTQTIEIPK